MKKLTICFLAAGLGLCLYSCSGENQQGGETSSTSGTIRIDGSSTVYPITEAVAEEYRSKAPKVKLLVGFSGTGGGFKKFCRGETDISDASRPIKDKEVQACSGKNIEYLELEVAYDGLAVLINPKNDWVDHLTTAELKKIWEPAAQNKITNWNQVRPGFPDRKLVLLGPGTASGTFDYFTEVIVGKSGSCRGDYMPSEDDNVLVQGVAGEENALGFFGLAYYEENTDKLKLVPVDSGDGPVAPSMETVKTGTYKPLSRPLFIYVNSESVKRSEVRNFVEFYLKNARELATDVGYVSLPEEFYNQQLEKFKVFADKHSETSAAVMK